MRWIVLVLLCSCGRSLPPMCEQRAPAPVALPLGIAGRPLEFTVQHVTGCTAAAPAAVAGGTDPHGMPIDVVVRGDVTSAYGVATARLGFSPQEPGRYHVIARFPPSEGLEQLDVFVARDLRAAAATLELDAGWASCRPRRRAPLGDADLSDATERARVT